MKTGFQLHPEGYFSVDGEVALNEAQATAGVEIPAVLKGLAARQLGDGRWAVMADGDQRGPTVEEEAALNDLLAVADKAVQAEKDAKEAKRVAGELARGAAGVEPTDVEVRLRALEAKIGSPTEEELTAARAELVAEAAPTAPAEEMKS